MDSFQVMYKVANRERPPVSNLVPCQYAALLKECWDEDPSKRPSFVEICERLDGIARELKY